MGREFTTVGTATAGPGDRGGAWRIFGRRGCRRDGGVPGRGRRLLLAGHTHVGLDRRAAVRELQIRFAGWAADSPKQTYVAVDGDFGPGTAAALKRFQAANHLAVHLERRHGVRQRHLYGRAPARRQPGRTRLRLAGLVGESGTVS
ncbi:peptidoglycan-binding domain-containing protein [Amycolatopsis sp. DG1A-15b]|uniref:peptidoglycan-binding domain-containing protein n=1 Tax=Amycolatopsis sp. DG1A-15b TaxID=3052846 RepID=UPI00255C052D|nr:peptidoglycan-binding domain-containing protein [Amycolatopsis sp. DG1A-15b]WIX91831.1 peptidoglycan-binding domain-containing protein [Amycolatopsis sp. DG1A-15b]